MSSSRSPDRENGLTLLRVQPQGLYQYFCQELGVKPNSAVVRQLSDVCLLCDDRSGADPVAEKDQRNGSCSGSRIMDLSANFLGCEGIRPLLQTIRVVHYFTHLDLSGNLLDSKAVGELTRYMDGVVSLKSINLTSNPHITQLGGRHLKLFAATNANIVHVDGLETTHIPPALAKVIVRLCENNKTLQANTSLYHEKLTWQKRIRGAQGPPGSLQPTPMKRGPSTDPVGGAGGVLSRNGSTARGDSQTFVDNDGALMNSFALRQSCLGQLLLPPFQSHAELKLGIAGLTPHKDSSDDQLPPSPLPHMRAGDVALPLAENEGFLVPMTFVFAAALNPQQQQQPISPTSEAGEYSALRLLYEVMCEEDPQ